jgi:hypothetical protein
VSRQRQRQDQNQFSLPFEQTELPLTPQAAAVIHAHLPPAVLPPLLITAHWPNEIDGVPIPTPLREAVEREVFGTEENGDPVDPTPAEVLAITLYHGERLTELLESARHVDELLANRPSHGREELIRRKETVRCQMQSVLALYAEDFGEVAARHFQSWAERKLAEERGEGASDQHEPDAEPECSATTPTTPQRTQSAAAPEASVKQPRNPSLFEPAMAKAPEATTVNSSAEPIAEETLPTRPRIKARSTSRGERLEQIHENIDQALDKLAESLDAGRSEALRGWLTTMSRFHDYSLNNQILIAFQRPDATHVAGFHAWKKFNRLVNKGEKGIMILAPVTKPVGKVEQQDERGNKTEKTLRKLVNTKTVYVFDISQTHGDPLPELARVTGDAAEHLVNLKELIASKGIELFYAERLPRGAQGNSQGGRIGCRKGLSPAEEFRTLAHELAHELLHRGERREQTTVRSRELEAESVAFIVCSAIGLDARQCSTDYIHLYRGNKQMLLESLQFIRGVSKEILSALTSPGHQAARDSSFAE